MTSRAEVSMIVSRAPFTAFGALLAACAASSVIPRPVSLCAAQRDQRPFDPSNVYSLSGQYDLAVTWDRGVRLPAVRQGTLHLQPADTLFRYYEQVMWRTLEWRRRQNGERPLWGWTDAAFISPRQATSTDSLAPGVFYDTQLSALIVGRRPRVTDGGFDWLRITWISATGFGGTFEPDMGIAVVVDSATGQVVPQGGYFCARRRSR